MAKTQNSKVVAVRSIKISEPAYQRLKLMALRSNQRLYQVVDNLVQGTARNGSSKTRGGK